MIPVAAIVGASQYEKNPWRFISMVLIGVGCASFVHYMSPKRHRVYSHSGIYAITAPKPKSLKNTQEQIDICENYVRSFEQTQDICVDCRPQLKKFCGINPDEILTNLRGC